MPAIDFTKPVNLVKAANKRPASGTNWYLHSGDKYPGLYLAVGKKGATWYVRKRDEAGVMRGKSLRVKYPDTTADDAMKLLKAREGIEKGRITDDISTVRGAWKARCHTRLVNGKTSQKNVDDLTRKLERHARRILDMHPANVTQEHVQKCINAIETHDGKNSAATKRHVRVALSGVFRHISGDNPTENVVVPEANEQQPLWYDLCRKRRDLDPEDLSTIWEAMFQERQRDVLRGTAWMVMLFTGLRSEDVRDLVWQPSDRFGAVDLERGEITFPKLKSGVEYRTIPVAPIVVEMLTAIRSNHDHVFPASNRLGYIDQLRTLKTTLNGVKTPICRQKDTRDFFQEACGEGMLPTNVTAFLRGDVGADGAGKIMMKYTHRVGKAPVAMIEEVMVERIGAAFDREALFKVGF